MGIDEDMKECAIEYGIGLARVRQDCRLYKKRGLEYFKIMLDKNPISNNVSTNVCYMADVVSIVLDNPSLLERIVQFLSAA